MWVQVVIGAAMLAVGFLAGTAVHPRDLRREVRDLEARLSLARHARDRLRDALDRASGVSGELHKQLNRERTYATYAQGRIEELKAERQRLRAERAEDHERQIRLLERLEDAETTLRSSRERIDDVVASLDIWRGMVEDDNYDVTDLGQDLNYLSRQLRVDGSSVEVEAAPALEGGDRS